MLAVNGSTSKALGAGGNAPAASLAANGKTFMPGCFFRVVNGAVRLPKMRQSSGGFEFEFTRNMDCARSTPWYVGWSVAEAVQLQVFIYGFTGRFHKLNRLLESVFQAILEIYTRCISLANSVCYIVYGYHNMGIYGPMDGK